MTETSDGNLPGDQGITCQRDFDWDLEGGWVLAGTRDGHCGKERGLGLDGTRVCDPGG